MTVSRPRYRPKRMGTDKNNVKGIRRRMKAAVIEVPEEKNEIETIKSVETYTDADIRRCILAGQDGDAQTYIRLNQGLYCYDSTTGRFYKFNGAYWTEDLIDDSLTAGINLVIDCYNKQLGKMKNEGVEQNNLIWKATNRKISQLQNLSYKKSVRELASRGNDGIGISGDEWDRHPLKLSMKNGYIELSIGRRFPSKPEHYFLNHIARDYEEDAGFPKEFIKFLVSIFQYTIPAPRPEEFQHDNDAEKLTLEDRKAYEEALSQWEETRKRYPLIMVEFMQRLFGYSLRGDVREHILIVFHGKGRNGKGVLVDLILHVLGEYAGAVQPELLLSSSRATSSANAAPDILDLRGRRVVFASETNEGRQLDSSNVKRLVGGDQLVGRALFAKHLTRFEPSHTLFLITNNKPMAPPDDFALWQRLILIPFMVSFVEDPDPNDPSQGLIDKDLAAKLKAEAPKIVKWLVEGHIKYMAGGLKIPDVIKESTRQYQRDSDILGIFIEDACQVGKGHSIMGKGLYKAYVGWCDDNGHKPYSNKKFSEKMRLRFNRARINSGYRYDGIFSDYQSDSDRRWESQ